MLTEGRASPVLCDIEEHAGRLVVKVVREGHGSIGRSKKDRNAARHDDLARAASGC